MKLLFKLTVKYTAFIGILALSLPHNSFAYELNLLEIDKPTHQAISTTQKIRDKLSSLLDKPVNTIPISKINTLNKKNLLITLGSPSFEQALNKTSDASILAIFISKHSFNNIKNKNKNKQRVSAIFSEPSPFRQVALIKALYGASATSGYIKTIYSNSYINEYKSAAKLLDVELVTANHDNNQPNNTLKYLSNTRSLILLKDRNLLSKLKVSDILLKSYDLNQQGIIGFSSGLVKNGGLATTYSTVANIASSVYKEFIHLKNTDSLSPPHYSNFYEVASNRYVMRSLNIIEASNKKLKEYISNYEERLMK